MPGKRHNDASYRYLTPLQFYRQVTTADATDVVSINNIPEVIPMHQPESQDPACAQITLAYDNILQLAILCPSTTTDLIIQVYSWAAVAANLPQPPVDPGLTGWALVAERCLPCSAWTTIEHIPPYPTKVLVTSLSDTGPVTILYGRSE